MAAQRSGQFVIELRLLDRILHSAATFDAILNRYA